MKKIWQQQRWQHNDSSLRRFEGNRWATKANEWMAGQHTPKQLAQRGSITSLDSTSASTTSSRDSEKPLIERYSHSTVECQVVRIFARLFGLESDPNSLDRLLSAFALLRLCKYGLTDVVLVLTVAFCQLRRVLDVIPGTQHLERVNIVMLQMFIAHSWILDETCPLKEWHLHLFKPYCSFEVMNDALMKLLQLQRYRLQVAEDDIAEVFSTLAPDIPMPVW